MAAQTAGRQLRELARVPEPSRAVRCRPLPLRGLSSGVGL